jgi:hypothetical protein
MPLPKDHTRKFPEISFPDYQYFIAETIDKYEPKIADNLIYLPDIRRIDRLSLIDLFQTFTKNLPIEKGCIKSMMQYLINTQALIDSLEYPAFMDLYMSSDAHGTVRPFDITLREFPSRYQPDKIAFLRQDLLANILIPDWNIYSKAQPFCSMTPVQMLYSPYYSADQQELGI